MSKINDFFKENGSIIIVICGCILFGLLMWMCFSQMHQYGDVTTRYVPEKIHITLSPSADSMTIAKMNSEISLLNAKIDSTITLINTWNKNCDEGLWGGLSDLRQETNNVIDKLNGWLSFWIGILAIVGALIPAMSQLMERKKFDSKLEEIEKQSEKMEGIIDSERKKMEKSIEEVVNQKKEIESTRFVSKISEITFTLMECSDSIWHIDDYDRNDYCQDLLNKLSETTSSFFEMINKNKTLDPYHESLKMVLLQLLAAYNACKPLSIFKHRLKQLDKLTNDIGAILHDFHKKSFMEYELNDVLRQMKEIRIV